jgi:hypothetical protein
MTAKKYMLPELEQQAYNEFKRTVWQLTDAEKVFEALETLVEYEVEVPAVSNVMQQLRDQHILILLPLPAFRAYLDQFAAPTTNIAEVKFVKCETCGVKLVERKAGLPMANEVVTFGTGAESFMPKHRCSGYSYRSEGLVQAESYPQF